MWWVADSGTWCSVAVESYSRRPHCSRLGARLTETGSSVLSQVMQTSTRENAANATRYFFDLRRVVEEVHRAVALLRHIVVLRGDRHHRHAGLHQPPRGDVLVAPAVPLAELRRFLRDIERVAGNVGRHHVECLRGERVHARALALR